MRRSLRLWSWSRQAGTLTAVRGVAAPIYRDFHKGISGAGLLGRLNQNLRTGTTAEPYGYVAAHGPQASRLRNLTYGRATATAIWSSLALSGRHSATSWRVGDDGWGAVVLCDMPALTSRQARPESRLFGHATDTRDLEPICIWDRRSCRHVGIDLVRMRLSSPSEN